MTTAVQHRRGTTAEHAVFTGLEGEVTIDTTKDTAVIHDGTLAGGYPLAKENLANVTTSGLSSIDGASTASDDKFFIYDQSATSLKTITRAELNNAIEQDALANVAITGGTINGTTIGGTTAAAVSATTLTTSSTVTHNGGSANGVCFLNGSKVLTTGSALTFDGTLLTNSGAAGGVRLAVVSTGSSPEVSITSADTGTSQINFGGATTPKKGRMTYSDNSDVFLWSLNNGSEQMRLTSTGLGIGTSSPAYKLDVLGTSRIYQSGNTAASLMLNANQGSLSTGYAFTLAQSNSSGNYNFTIAEGATTYLTLTNSISGAGGNLGLGVTPSAVDNNYRTLQVGHAAFLYSGNNQFTSYAELAANTIFDALSTAQYKNTGFATRYQQNQGQHNWYTAPSGTAGDAISFSQSMTLDASGNLGVGDTSPSSNGKVSISVPSLAGYSASVAAWSASNGTGAMRLWIANLAYAGVGANEPWLHSYQNINIGSDANIAIKFISGGEKARIDSSGNLLVGTTSAVGKLSVLGNAGGTCATFNADSNTVTPVGIIVGANDTTQAALYVYSGSNGLFNAYIYSNGNLQNRNNSYGGISDVKAKENIVDASPKLADLMQVKVRNYNLIGDTTKQLGVVAQELETVFPAMVDETPDKDIEGNDLGTTTKSVKYSVFVPMLIKAIQEQQAIIESLKARLDAANL